MIWETEEDRELKEEAKTAKDGNDSLSIEHKEQIYYLTLCHSSRAFAAL